jgi:hypothetical protein
MHEECPQCISLDVWQEPVHESAALFLFCYDQQEKKKSTKKQQTERVPKVSACRMVVQPIEVNSTE